MIFSEPLTTQLRAIHLTIAIISGFMYTEIRLK